MSLSNFSSHLSLSPRLSALPPALCSSLLSAEHKTLPTVPGPGSQSSSGQVSGLSISASPGGPTSCCSLCWSLEVTAGKAHMSLVPLVTLCSHSTHSHCSPGSLLTDHSLVVACLQSPVHGPGHHLQPSIPQPRPGSPESVVRGLSLR